jgi:hypothetical protein
MHNDLRDLQSLSDHLHALGSAPRSPEYPTQLAQAGGPQKLIVFLRYDPHGHHLLFEAQHVRWGSIGKHEIQEKQKEITREIS